MTRRAGFSRAFSWTSLAECFHTRFWEGFRAWCHPGGRVRCTFCGGDDGIVILSTRFFVLSGRRNQHHCSKCSQRNSTHCTFTVGTILRQFSGVEQQQVRTKMRQPICLHAYPNYCARVRNKWSMFQGRRESSASLTPRQACIIATVLRVTCPTPSLLLFGYQMSKCMCMFSKSSHPWRAVRQHPRGPSPPTTLLPRTTHPLFCAFPKRTDTEKHVDSRQRQSEQQTATCVRVPAPRFSI